MSNNHLTYTYLIGWSNHNKWYYGRRTAKGCHPTELWKTYFTSSKYVKEFRKINGEPDIIQIRKIFSDKKECSKWESRVLLRLDVQHTEKWLNQKNGDEFWDFSGRKLTEIHIQKLRQPKTQEHREKLSKSKKGKIPPCVFTRKKYIGSNNPKAKKCISPDGTIFNSAFDAAEKLGINVKNIQYRCRMKTMGWSYFDLSQSGTFTK